MKRSDFILPECLKNLNPALVVDREFIVRDNEYWRKLREEMKKYADARRRGMEKDLENPTFYCFS